jgi:SAM-dependent methyltransferase
MSREKQTYLQINQHLIKDKIVLDLACHDGKSTEIIKKLGAKHIYGVEARQDLLTEAKKNIEGDVDFFVGDIQDEKIISSLVKKSDTVIALGVLYHLYNHFGFFSYILKPNIDYVLIETIAGPETLDPSMAWGFEDMARQTYPGFSLHPIFLGSLVTGHGHMARYQLKRDTTSRIRSIWTRKVVIGLSTKKLFLMTSCQTTF